VYNVYLKLAYNGSRYHGSQKQNTTDQTVQGVLDEAIKKLFVINEVKTLFSGRTDAGVHASGQVVNFKTKRLMPFSNIKSGLNTFLPDDVRVLIADKVRGSFHARYMAERREYIYNIFVGEEVPLYLYDYVWHLKKMPNLEIMNKAAKCFLGSKDFTAFSITGSQEKSGIRNIFEAELNSQDQVGSWLGCTQSSGVLISFRIEATSFLYRMVRLIVGTLVAAGYDELSVDEISNIIASHDRSMLRVAAAPAKGLVLNKVTYNKSEGL